MKALSIKVLCTLFVCFNFISSFSQCQIETSPTMPDICEGTSGYFYEVVATHNIILCNGTFSWEMDEPSTPDITISDGRALATLNTSVDETGNNDTIRIEIASFTLDFTQEFAFNLILKLDGSLYDTEEFHYTIYNSVTGGSISGSQEVCEGDDPAQITSTTDPDDGFGTWTYDWEYQSECTGTWSSLSSNSLEYTPAAGISESGCYRRVASNDCGLDYSNIVTIDMATSVDPGSISGNQTICEGGNPANISSNEDPSGGKGSWTYSWEYQSECTGTWQSISANSLSYDPPANLNEQRCYRRTASNDCGSESSNSVTIDLHPAITGGAIGSNQTISSGGDPVAFTNETSPSGGNGTWTYNWEYQDNCTGGWTSLGVNNLTYDPPSGLTNSRCYRRYASNDCDGEYSNTVSVAIASALNAGVIESDQTICENTSPATITNQTSPAGGVGTLTVNWYYSEDSNNPMIGTWNAITGATSESFTESSSLTASRYYVRRVSDSDSPANTAFSNVIGVFVKVTPSPTIKGEFEVGTNEIEDFWVDAIPTNTYTWEIDGGTINTDNHNEISVSWNTNGAKSLQVTEFAGGIAACDGSDSKQIIVRPGINLALVLDKSGSMNGTSGTSTISKWNALTQAIEAFMGLMSDANVVETDSLTLIYFDSNVSDFQISGNSLISLDEADTINMDLLESNLSSTSPGGSTAMGGGLQMAINTINQGINPKNIILVTDGMQNKNPMVNTTTLAIENQAGRSNSNISPTVPETVLNGGLGIKVYPISIGDHASYHDLLIDIKDATGGSYKNVIEPDIQLDEFLVQIYEEMRSDYSPQIVDFRKGTISGKTNENFNINAKVEKLIFQVITSEGNNIDFSIKKDGITLPKSSYQIKNKGFYSVATVFLPCKIDGKTITSKGTWVLNIEGKESIKYKCLAIAEEHHFDYSTLIYNDDISIGDKIQFAVNLSLDNKAINGAKVSAIVLKPGEDLGTLLSTTSAKTLSQNRKTIVKKDRKATAKYAKKNVYVKDIQDAAAIKYEMLLNAGLLKEVFNRKETVITLNNTGRGRYYGTYAQTDVAGAYQIIFLIEYKDGSYGIINRRRTDFVNVNFGSLSTENTEVGFNPGRIGKTPSTITIRPVNKSGKYLGPGKANSINVSIPKQSIQKVVDNLDGSYTFVLNTSKDISTSNMSILINKDKLYHGKVKNFGKYENIPGTIKKVTQPVKIKKLNKIPSSNYRLITK